MTRPIVVTGASGALGRALTEQLTADGLPVRQALRDPAKSRAGADAVRFDYTDSATFAPALAGAGALVLMSPPLDPEAASRLTPVINLAAQTGVPGLVFISAFGANHNEQAPLRAVEHLVMNSGIPYAILRPNFFMENFSSGFLAHSIRGQNGIFVAAGDAKTSFISVDDIARVASALFQKGLASEQLDLTGLDAIDHAEAARIISSVSGRAVTYHALTPEQMDAGARSAGMPDGAISYLSALYSAVRAGYAAPVTGDVERVTGRPAINFRQFAERNADAWR